MSNFTTTPDILKYMLRSSGEIDNGNSPLHSVALEYLNLAYLKMLAGPSEYNVDCGQPFVWARSSTYLILKPIYETGTITLTNGSASATLSVVSTLSLTDYDLKADGEPDWFRISANSSGSAAVTLDAPFTGTTGSYAYKAIKIRYNLGTGILKLVEPLRIYRAQNGNDDRDKIFGMEINQFRDKFPMRFIANGIPSRFSNYEQVTTATQTYKIIMNAYTEEEVKIDYDYVAQPSALTDDASSLPLVPHAFRKVLGDMGASMLLKDEKKQYEDSEKYLGYARQGLTAMTTEMNKKNQNTGANRGRLSARLR